MEPVQNCTGFIFCTFHSVVQLFAYWVILNTFLSSADFFQNQLFRKFLSGIPFRNTIRASNSLDPDQARHFVWSDLGPNCVQRLLADNTSRQRVNYIYVVFQYITECVKTDDNEVRQAMRTEASQESRDVLNHPAVKLLTAWKNFLVVLTKHNVRFTLVMLNK